MVLSLGALAVQPALALYDPAPIALLVHASGAWEGSLTYRDYQQPDRMVTLPATVAVSFSAPDELAFYYAFDDGPGKTVHSYERMRFDLARSRLTWVSGTKASDRSVHRITASGVDATTTTIRFEREVDSRVDRHVIEITPSRWSLVKHEHTGDKSPLLRNRYAFTRR
jgi:hypothetical protein